MLIDNPQNWNTLISDRKNEPAIIISKISTSNVSGKLIGSPSDAYTYGVLISVISNCNYYSCGQIYIQHNREEIYMRTLGDGIASGSETIIGNKWRKISGTLVDSTS